MNTRILFFLVAMFAMPLVYGQGEFITTWEVTSDDLSITIPINDGVSNTYPYSYNVDWGDGQNSTGVSTDASHTYGAAGTYTVKITGTFPAINMNYEGDTGKIRTIEQWGVIAWKSMSHAFDGCSQLQLTATDVPDLSAVTDFGAMFKSAVAFTGNASMSSWNTSAATTMAGMFNNAQLFNAAISSWNTANVTDMSNMFNTAKAFNQNIGGWDVSKVENMRLMFSKTSVFNQNLSSWNTGLVKNMSDMFNGAIAFNQPLFVTTGSVVTMIRMFEGAVAFNQPLFFTTASVTNMNAMFKNATVFNQPLNSWNVSNVTDMTYMFSGARAFNQDLNSWDVRKVTNMRYMFAGNASAVPSAFNGNITGWNTAVLTNINSIFRYNEGFNQDISNWNVGNVTDMERAFNGATAFNQPLNSWNVSSATTMRFMFLAANSYNRPLNSWNVSNVTNMNGMFFGTTKFNQPINSWNVSNVTDMGGMFSYATAFNQPLNSWTVSSVTDMSAMFHNTTTFNQSIDSWNVGSVTNMNSMFNNAIAFNQPLNSWNVSNVTDMRQMFRSAHAFNQPIGSWNIGKVTNMYAMFNNALAFNQNIGKWTYSSIESAGSGTATGLTAIFNQTNISRSNYDNILIGLANQSLPDNLSIGVSGLVYCGGTSSRNILIAKGLTFTGDAPAGSCVGGPAAGSGSLSCSTPSYTLPSGVTVTESGTYEMVFPSSTPGTDSIVMAVISNPAGVAVGSYTQDLISNQSIAANASLQLTAKTNLASFAQFKKDDNDWVEIDAVVPSLVNKNRSIFLWMRQTATVAGTSQVLVGINTSSGGNICNLQISTDEKLSVYDGANARSSGVIVTDGEWHHVGYTYDEATDETKIYVDGVLRTTYTNGQSITATDKISIGQEFDAGLTRGNFFEGEMTEISFWDEVLTSGEIALLKAAPIYGNHPKYANLQAYYPMVIACGETASTQLKDYSGNNYHGTAYANTTAVSTIHNQDSLTTITNFNTQAWYSKAWVYDEAGALSTDSAINIAKPITGSYVISFANSKYFFKEVFDVEVAGQVVWKDGAWSPNTPTATDDVVIKTTYDVATQGDINCNNIIIQEGKTLIQGSGSINISGNFTNSGTFTQTGGAVTFNGTTAQTITGTTTFNNLIINNSNGVTLNDATTVTGKLTLSSGTLASDGNLTLAASQSGSAYIVDGGGSVSGNVTMQSYTRDNSGTSWSNYSGQGYRHYSSPMANATVGGFTGFTVEISQAALFNANWNQVVNPYPNFFFFDESRITNADADAQSFNKGWVAPTSGSDAIAPGRGFSANMPTGISASMTGPLNDGNVVIGVSKGTEAASGWNLLGNPYPSPISFSAFRASNSAVIDNSVYISIATSQYGNGWAAYVNGVGSPAGAIDNGYLSPMQGFFVSKTNAGNDDVTFQDSHRVDGSFNFYRKKNQKDGLLRLQVSANDKQDELVVYLEEGATAGFDSDFDAYKAGYNPKGYPTLSVKTEGKKLSISGLPAGFEATQIIALELWAEYDGLHEFKASEFQYFNADMEVYLEDRDEETMQELYDGAVYDFKASKGFQKDRFFLHIGRKKPEAEVLGDAELQLFSHGKTIELRQPAGNATIIVFDLAGRQLEQYQAEGDASIPTVLPKGIYIVQVQTERGVIAKKLRVE